MTVVKQALLVVPHISVDDANIISGPLTWGFPAMTAFTGLMTALERKLGKDVSFFKVGVIVHSFSPRVNEERPRRFYPTKFPGDRDGLNSPIQEEGKGSFTISLVFDIEASIDFLQEHTSEFLSHVVDTLKFMRVAGGTVVSLETARLKAMIHICKEEADDEAKAIKKLMYRLMPGTALISRHDLLVGLPETERLERWLDCGRLTMAYDPTDSAWHTAKKEGWLVPIPIGYIGLAPVQVANSVLNTRSNNPSQFVEAVYSIGQWLSLHRIRHASTMLWAPVNNDSTNSYICETQPVL